MAAAAQPTPTSESPTAPLSKPTPPPGKLNARPVTQGGCGCKELSIKISIVVGIVIFSFGVFSIGGIFPAVFLGGMRGAVCVTVAGGVIALIGAIQHSRLPSPATARSPSPVHTDKSD